MLHVESGSKKFHFNEFSLFIFNLNNLFYAELMKSRVESKKSLGSHVKEKWPSVYKHGELNRKWETIWMEKKKSI